ncbi:MAG: hypothetical protein WC956_03195, partial [bacterium]
MKRAKINLIRHSIAVVAIIAGFAAAAAWLVNRPETLRHTLAIANARGDWHIEAEGFHWSPLSSEIVVHSINVEQRSTGKKVAIYKVSARYRLLGLLRGKFVIDSLVIDNARIELPPRDPTQPKKPHERINLARLLLLKNIELVDGRVNGLRLSFGKGFVLANDQVEFALMPSIFGESKFAIRADGAYLKKADRDIISAGVVSLKTSTALERWASDFPYLNAFSGTLKIQDATVEGVTADSVEADVSYNDDAIKMEKLLLDFEGRRLAGKFDANIADQSYDLAIAIPNPIILPYIGKRMETLDTAGELTASIHLKGKGFVPKEADGEGHVEITHRFDVAREAPITVASDLVLKSGVIKFNNAGALAGQDGFAFAGEIDIPGKRFAFSAKGSRFPVEHVFDKFRNKHLRKIFGPSDFEAAFEGWGKKFKADVRGTAYNGGWRPLAVGRVETELVATYDDLSLKGVIFTAGRESGTADLNIKFGAKIPGENRSKFIDLVAEVHNADLAEAMGSLGLAGNGNGTIAFKGPHTSFTGKAQATIDKGTWHGLPFDSASTDMNITRQKLTFDNMQLSLPGGAVQKATAPLVADITEGALRLHG